MLLLLHTNTDPNANTAQGLAAAWTTRTVTDHPPIPAVEPHLQERLNSPAVRDRRLCWHPQDGNAWAVVVDLHRGGHHDKATEWARLLAWCDARHSGRDHVIWEITGGGE